MNRSIKYIYDSKFSSTIFFYETALKFIFWSFFIKLIRFFKWSNFTGKINLIRTSNNQIITDRKQAIRKAHTHKKKKGRLKCMLEMKNSTSFVFSSNWYLLKLLMTNRCQKLITKINKMYFSLMHCTSFEKERWERKGPRPQCSLNARVTSFRNLHGRQAYRIVLKLFWERELLPSSTEPIFKISG